MNKLLTISCLAVAFIAFAAGCNSSAETHNPADADLSPVASIPSSSSCPFITVSDKKEVVLSWVQSTSDSTFVLCYAVGNENGTTFGDTITIPGTEDVLAHAENMPKMIFKPSGEIIAMWGTDSKSSGNKYAGAVFYVQSFDGGKSWTGRTPLVNDTSSHDQRYFDLALLPDGEAGVIWLDDRKQTEGEGSTLYFAATSGKNGFTNEKPVGVTCCQCCRTDLFVDSEQNIHVAYRKIINDSIRDMVHSVSVDHGVTFSKAVRISVDNWVINGCPHTGPSMTECGGRMHFSWYTMGNASGVFYCSSADNGIRFSPRDSVSSKSTAKHSQIASTKDNEIVVVWDESFAAGESTRSRIGVQRRSGEGTILATEFIAEDDGGVEYPVQLVIPSNKIFVAYTVKGEWGSRVEYRVIH